MYNLNAEKVFMKSIIQEASSVMKAIEQGWQKAGKPKEFSLKIFEEPQKNFIGLTIKKAKIGLFFEAAKPEFIKPEKKRPIQKREKKVIPPKKAEQREIKPTPQERVIWTPEMIKESQQWIKGILTIIKRPEVSFNTEVSHYQLRLTFNKPVEQDLEKSRLLFRSFSVLLMQTLRHKFKRPLRGFKIIITQ